MASNHTLQTELATYDAHKENLLDREGKFVLIHGQDIGGVWDTYADALQAGYHSCGIEPFLIKQIQGTERVHFIAGDACRL